LIFLNSSIPQLFTFPFIAKSLLHKTQDGLSSQLPFASLTRKLQFRHFIVILLLPRVLFYFNFQFFCTSIIYILRRQFNHGPKSSPKSCLYIPILLDFMAKNLSSQEIALLFYSFKLRKKKQLINRFEFISVIKFASDWLF